MTHEEYDDLDELPEAPRSPGISPEDYELLSLAALAIGCEDVEAVEGEQYVNLHFPDGSSIHAWNPKRHSDDAFELAVTLGFVVEVDRERGRTTVKYPGYEDIEVDANEHLDLSGAARLVITRAAAEIGKLM